MSLKKCADKKITMIISILTLIIQWYGIFFTHFNKIIRKQMVQIWIFRTLYDDNQIKLMKLIKQFLKNLNTKYLIDHQMKIWTIIFANQFGCIPLFPIFLIFTNISFETFLSPWTGNRITDWCKCRNAFV